MNWRKPVCIVECWVSAFGFQYSFNNHIYYIRQNYQPDQVEEHPYSKTYKEELNISFVEVVEEKDGKDEEGAQDGVEVMFVEHEEEV